MTPVIVIGSAGFDLVHVILALALIGLAVYLWQARQSAGFEREELTLLRQRTQTLEAVARDSELKLA